MRRSTYRSATQRSVPSILLLTSVCVFTTAAEADPAPGRAGGPLVWENTGSGDWGGARAELAEKGFTFVANYDLYMQYNTTGGIDSGGAIESRLVPELNFQLEPLLGLWKGSEFQVSGAWNQGQDINDNVGAIIGPSTIYRESAVRLYELYYGQYLFDDQVHFKIGRLGLGPLEFAYSLFLYDYMSAGYDSSPGALFINQPVTTFAYPIATWGARILIAPKDEDFTVRLGVYNGWPRNLADDDENGVEFSLNLNVSTFFIGEFAYQLNQDPEDDGLPGNYKIGVMYDTGPFDRLDNPSKTEHGNFGVYVIGDQMLFREEAPLDLPDHHPANWKGGFKSSHPTDQGLYAWATFVANPEKSINFAPYWVSGGLAYKGLIPSRDADRTGVGFYYAFLSSDSAADYEFMLEAFHQFQITPWISVGPDIQYFANPGGVDAADAFVVGIQLVSNF